MNWIRSQNIVTTLQGDKLTVRLSSEEQGQQLLGKFYGLGAFEDAFELQRNLYRQGHLRNYRYGNVASPAVEGALASQGEFTINNVSYDKAYPFEGGTEPAVRYSVNVKGKNIAIVIPADLANHQQYLNTLKACFDKSSKSALNELKVVRIDPKTGYSFKYADETTGTHFQSHAIASADTEKGIMTFYNGELNEATYFHELAHLIADEFFNYFKSKGHPFATGFHSNPADPHTIWDHAISNERNVRDHGSNNPRIEDFANSIEQWVQGSLKFSLAYPKRGTLIDEFVANGGLIDRHHPNAPASLGSDLQRKKILDLGQRLNDVLPTWAKIESANVHTGIVSLYDKQMVEYRVPIHSGLNAQNRSLKAIDLANNLVKATDSALPDFWKISLVDLANGASRARVEFSGISGTKSVTIDMTKSNWKPTLHDTILKMKLPATRPG